MKMNSMLLFLRGLRESLSQAAIHIIFAIFQFQSQTVNWVIKVEKPFYFAASREYYIYMFHIRRRAPLNANTHTQREKWGKK